MQTASTDLAAQLDAILPTALTGCVVQTVALTASVADFPAPVGAVVRIERQGGDEVEAEVVGFRDEHTIVYPLGSTAGIRRGSRVRMVSSSRSLRVGDALLGRVINARGMPIDRRPLARLPHRVLLDQAPPPAVERPRIREPLSTGVRAVDGLLTCGRGQRIGIFAGSGVGKSVLLGMMARYTAADVNVIALIGERGREVNEFIERDLGPEGLARSVVLVATSDEPGLSRVQAAFAATSVAEYFRDQGKDVLLLMDSVTRLAMAQREIGLAAGEPPATRGYPPSVFGLLPRVVERAGRTEQGSITGLFTVLVEGDDTSEPISDTVRGLLDGHVVLSRRLAEAGHYPAIDILGSISRLFPKLATPEQNDAALVVRRLLAALRDNEDLISVGAYRAGSNALVDAALAVRDPLHELLRQRVEESSNVADARGRLAEFVARLSGLAGPAEVPAQEVAAQSSESPRETQPSHERSNLAP